MRDTPRLVGPAEMTVACVLINHFRAKSELARRPELEGRAFAVSDRTRAGVRIADRSPQAVGVVPEMTLQQAVSVRSELVVLDADGPYYESLFERLLNSLGRVSDMVESGGLGEAYVRLDGLEGMYGSEAGVVSALLDAVSVRLNPRVGIADSKFVAYAAARGAQPTRPVRVGEDVAAFLAPKSVYLLPVSYQLKVALGRFGISLIGDVSAIGRAAMLDRFGREGLFAWELSTGVDHRPFVPRKVEESVVEYTTLPFATTSLEMMHAGLDLLLRRAFARAALRNRSVGTALLESASSGGEPWKVRVRFRIPVERWERASELMGERLGAEPPSHPIDDLSLTLSDLGGESGVQAGLIKDARESAQKTLVGVDRRLSACFGDARALYRAVEVAPWHPAPELRSLLVPIDPLASDSVRALHAPTPAEVSEVVRGGERRPAAVRVGRKWRDVESVTDHWKFDLWWLPQPMTRSYYRVESSDGRLSTLFLDETSGEWYSQAA